MPGKYKTPRGKTATDAKRRYNESAYDRLYPSVHKGKKEKYLAAAEAAGMSLNQWVEVALDAAAGIDSLSDQDDQGREQVQPLS